jgi:NAD(P)-dependent dehydrogenase (short-subunit alcohol dehydrogenase family)
VITARSTGAHPHPTFDGTLEETISELERSGIEARAVRADLSEPDGPDTVYEAAMKRFGRCDVLVNNAAYSPIAPFIDLPPSKWRAALMVNLWAPAALTRLFLPGMIDRGSGAVVNVGSVAAVSAIPSASPYCVTKAGLERLTEVVAGEMPVPGVTVACIRIDERIPTETDTMMRSLGIDGAPEGRISGEQFADSVVWLVSQPALSGRTLTLTELCTLQRRALAGVG